MKMGAGAPILDRHQARQYIDFFNTIRTKGAFSTLITIARFYLKLKSIYGFS